MSYAASRLAERVRIERAEHTSDAFGGVDIAWEELATVWAEVRALTGTAREDEVAAQPTARASYRVRIRARDDVNASMRLVWKERVLAIHALHLVDDVFDMLAVEEGL